MKIKALHVFSALIVLWVIAWAVAEFTSNRPRPTAPTDAAPTSAGAPAGSAASSSSPGLLKEDLKVGTGAVAEKGKTVEVHYTGTLTDGTKFDSSLDHGEPLSFTLGEGRVIPGWEEGLLGMKEGGKRKLTVPPDMGYGPQGTPDGKIPPNSTLLFEIELLSVK
jgi:FKBP-type peptidyl-prolyl cis-trans isomerase